MNELENLREEMCQAEVNRQVAIDLFGKRMNDAMARFKADMQYAREIERQAGIGNDTNA